MRTEVIYEPRGKAREYAPLALNIYQGECPHHCVYCYVDNVPGDFATGPYKPRKDIVAKVERDCQKLRAENRADFHREMPPILIEFMGDGYAPENEVTRDVLLVLAEYRMNVVVLTKAPQRALRDVRLFKHHGWWLGTTITCGDPDKLQRWEPDAPDFTSRVGGLRVFKDAGVKTWVSLEPVLYPEETLMAVGVCADFVDHWKVGKLNAGRNPDPELRRIEKETDWSRFVSDFKGLMAELDYRRTHEAGECEERTYYVKKSLRKYECEDQQDTA